MIITWFYCSMMMRFSVGNVLKKTVSVYEILHEGKNIAR